MINNIAKKKRMQFDEMEDIATIHLESCDNTEMRIAQLKLIFPILSSYSDSFFMGDFNFPDASEEEKHTQPQEFTDLWKEINKGYSGGRGGEVAATTDRGRYDRLIYSSKMFFGKSVALMGTDPIVELSTESEQVYPSDHKGIYYYFRFFDYFDYFDHFYVVIMIC